MEIIKTVIKPTVVRVDIGNELSADKLTVSGPVELDIENQGDFVDIISSIFENGKTSIIVDLSNITYIDSSGLWALFEGHKKALQQDGVLILLNPTKDVRRVLDITKMSAKLKIFTDLESALESLNL